MSSDAVATEVLVTAEELAQMPHSEEPIELVAGRVIRLSPATNEHGAIANEVSVALSIEARRTGCGRVFIAAAAYVLSRDPDTVRVPDVSFISAERLPGGRPVRAFFEGAPDLAVEVISPSETLADTEIKIQDYLKAGCKLLWLVYPNVRAVRVWRADGTTAFVHEGESLSGEDVLPGFELPVSDIFR